MTVWESTPSKPEWKIEKKIDEPCGEKTTRPDVRVVQGRTGMLWESLHTHGHPLEWFCAAAAAAARGTTGTGTGRTGTTATATARLCSPDRDTGDVQ
jgi:hypothetical protein